MKLFIAILFSLFTVGTANAQLAAAGAISGSSSDSSSASLSAASSNQGQQQGQGQLQGQGQQQGQSAVLVGGDTRVNSALVGGNTASFADGGKASAASVGGNNAASTGAANAGNSQNINISSPGTVEYKGSYTVRSAPGVVTPQVYPTAPCMGSSAVGGSGVGFGFSVGTSWKDDECGIRETARSFVALGLTVDAIKVLCTSQYAAAAPVCATVEPHPQPTK